MIIKRYKPINMLERMANALDFARDFDEMWDSATNLLSDNIWGVYEGDWSPPLDVYEDDDVYFIKIDVPGIESKDIDLSVTNDVLTIKGERKIERREDAGKKQGRSYQKEEQIYGAFHRTVPLPTPVDSGKVQANLKDGVLHISLPKREETKPKKISVNIS
jgi:HSP20 family protein